VQANPYSDPRNRYLWSTPCTGPARRAGGEPGGGRARCASTACATSPGPTTAAGCAAQHPALAEWLARQRRRAGPALRPPRLPVQHRDRRLGGAACGGGPAAAGARHPQRPGIPAGRPARPAWSAEVARAARTSTAMLDGTLALPPFPIALPR
jgi:hypothetical protein